MDQTHDDELPDGVSRWAFIVPGAAVGFAVGALPGAWVSFYLAWLLIDAGVPSFGRGLLLGCWLWCVLVATGVGAYLGYSIWRTDDAPRRKP